ncbi:putative Serine/threonine-protein kinase HT1 [Penicillium brasilianum]|uniref:Putative Serine/threonine-protein kinase HT1 n=1 Tax=Penicillium brasilianum TaxID=104259 RepID=A0A1S9RQ60_PENBI|nr:putative Serine/threonine-protein kinase HT1 [Penicillium brasilianum]
MSSPFLSIHGDPIPQEEVLRSGGSAVVLLQNEVAVKVPLRYPWSSDSDVRANTKSLRCEQAVYRRLEYPKDERSGGVVRYIGFLTEATQLAYMAKGDLRAYLAKCRPSHQLQLTWFREMASTLSYIHDRRVLVADIASRNFLLDSALSLKICDFSEASLLPLDSDMDGVDDNGFTTRIDIGLLGAVMHEVVTGNKCEVDLFKDNSPTDGRAHWPEGKLLPNTQDIWLSGIIEGCRDGEYSGVHSLLQALSSVALPSSSAVVQSRIARLLVDIRNTIHSRSIATIIGGLGLAAFALVVGKKALLMSWDYRRFL